MCLLEPSPCDKLEFSHHGCVFDMVDGSRFTLGGFEVLRYELPDPAGPGG